MDTRALQGWKHALYHRAMNLSTTIRAGLWQAWWTLRYGKMEHWPDAILGKYIFLDGVPEGLDAALQVPLAYSDLIKKLRLAGPTVTFLYIQEIMHPGINPDPAVQEGAARLMSLAATRPPRSVVYHMLIESGDFKHAKLAFLFPGDEYDAFTVWLNER